MTLAHNPALIVDVVRADNPGPMTLEGTNTWIVTSPESSSAILIDPGPALSAHEAQVDRHLAERELQVELILLTHGHLDHSESAAQFGRRHDAPVRAADARWATAEVLSHGEAINAAGVRLDVLATPGHTSDSVTFAAPEALFTGDTVLGRGTSVVAHPDGRLGDYLDSLVALHHIAQSGRFTVFPGHGPLQADAAGLLRAYLAHRYDRLNQVTAVLDEKYPGLRAEEHVAEGAAEPEWLADVVADVVNTVYAEVPDAVKAAAAHSVRAQLQYLIERSQGAVSASGEKVDRRR